ncbi:MAG TPA: hypothetical protein VNJ08_10305 [Bacteriovoracaceae bacterium]|nr:hypothetical protein [Bacteriovoracaceae bacterium]
MNTTKHLAYFGSDPEFKNTLSDYVVNCGAGECRCEVSGYSKGNLIDLVTFHPPHVVFIDFQLIDCKKDLLNEVMYIKRNFAYRSILFVAIFPDKSSMEQNKYAMTAGFSLFFIKGTEIKSLLRDAFYIAFNAASDFPAFSRARKIDKNINAGFCSSLFSIGKNEFLLESDLDVPTKMLNFELSVFPELSARTFTIKSKSNYISNYPMTTSYELELPIASIWNRESDFLLHKNTLDSWKDINRELLVPLPVYIKIFNRNQKLAWEVFEFYDASNFQLSFSSNVQSSELAHELASKKPPLIFFEIDSGSEEGSFESLMSLSTIVSSVMDELPLIVCSNNPSTTQATQKLLNYSKIICFAQPLSGQIFSLLTKSFLEKRKKVDLSNYIFNVDSKVRPLNLEFEVGIMSLTEHEITFDCSVPLPMFSLVQFNLPVGFTATIVPPLYEVTSRENSYHYMGFITGIDEASLTVLRKFINQIIYCPLDDYSDASIAGLVKSMNAVKKEEEIIIIAPVKILDFPVKKESGVNINPIRFSGKSKL